LYVSAGGAAAFAAPVVLAAGAGSLLPHRIVEAVVAVLMARRHDEAPPPVGDGDPGGRGGSWIIRRVRAEGGTRDELVGAEVAVELSQRGCGRR